MCKKKKAYDLLLDSMQEFISTVESGGELTVRVVPRMEEKKLKTRIKEMGEEELRMRLGEAYMRIEELNREVEELRKKIHGLDMDEH